MSAYSTKRKEKDDKPKPSAANENNNGGSKAAYALVDALKTIFHVNGDGPSALAALAISIAGDDLKYPVGEQMARIADAFDHIGDQLERIADAYEVEEE